ncbi:MAG: phosphatidylinositol mannoside acyltransferase [bacterium]|nr:phosphatidylinositol mannoside acyltransferase [bacterium]MCY4257587.1 phosphatidylinositol mannoside acyltransferase [bacterium]
MIRSDELIYRGGAVLARRLPRTIGAGLTRFVSNSAYRVLPERRFITERRLRRVYGSEVSGAELAAMGRASFGSYARYWYDGARICNLADTEIEAGFGVEGFEHIQAALETGVAPILALPHLGGWEWAGAWMARIAGYPVISVVEPPTNRRLFEWMVTQRQRLGIDILPLGADAATALIKSVRSGQVVCLLSDRQVGSGGVEVEFFGEKTLLPAGPAAIALRTGAALLPTAVYQHPSHPQTQHRAGRYSLTRHRARGHRARGHRARGHRAVVLPPVAAQREGRLRADVARVTQDLARCLEQLILVAPEQWHLMQPNWPSDHQAVEQFRKQRRKSRQRP